MITDHDVIPLLQDRRPPCSVPLEDPDMTLGNRNWTKGLQAMSDWIWGAHLNPDVNQEAFRNHLARFFLQIPGVFEQQLNFSTTLIFDEPSFKNGVQISGFVHRVARELAISLIAQRRRCWYSMTHHAILGKFTAIKHGLDDQEYADKWGNLIEHHDHPEFYTRMERAVLVFADAFATDPKTLTDVQFEELRAALHEANQESYRDQELPQRRLDAARIAKATALLDYTSPDAIDHNTIDEICQQAAADVSDQMPDALNDAKVEAQVVELACLCMQFVALTCVFSGLNIPDEDFLAGFLQALVPGPVIDKLNALNELGLKADVPELIPAPATADAAALNVGGPLFEAILSGDVEVEPARPKQPPHPRITATPYEGKDEKGNFRPAFAVSADGDYGLTIGGVQSGVYGWSFGGHFPGNLIYALMKHPELARYEAPYSLPVMFNEDEWRNGVQTAGFVSRRMKELVMQKVYRLNRSRYGLEHHTMFLYNTFFDEHGVGRGPKPEFSEQQQSSARALARRRADLAVLYTLDHENAPEGVFTETERAVLSWVECLLRTPHRAYKQEQSVRDSLDRENRREVRAGLRRLDRSPDLDDDAAFARLLDHQIAALAMLTGHMDGVGRMMTVLQLEAEEAVQVVEGRPGPTGGIIADRDEHDQVKFTGYFNNRASLHGVFVWLGMSKAALTLNELLLNPDLCRSIQERLANGERQIRVSQAQASETAEF